jgi:activator of 2-hydroxyglutaryl-CoA dehydratase
MGLGHMLWQSGVSPFDITAAMEGHSSALEEGFQCGIGETDIEPLMNQLIRDTVVMVIHFDVVIDIDLWSAPFSENVAMGWQGFEGGFVQALKEAFTGSLDFFKGTVIEDLQLFCNGLIELNEGEESAMSQRGKDPAFHLQDP